MSDLQDALDWYDLRGATFVNKEWDPIVEAARLVANGIVLGEWDTQDSLEFQWQPGLNGRTIIAITPALTPPEDTFKGITIEDNTFTPPGDT